MSKLVTLAIIRLIYRRNVMKKVKKLFDDKTIYHIKMPFSDALLNEYNSRDH